MTVQKCFEQNIEKRFFKLGFTESTIIFTYTCTVKPEYNNHPRYPKIVPLWKTGRQTSSRCSQVVVIRSWSLAQV
jgi:hypothetical protein